MVTDKRPRGRPRGTGKDDSPYLAQVADLLVRDSALKPTTAMKRVMIGRKDWDVTDTTLLRRWQVKWKDTGHSFLEAARKRNAPKPSTTRGGGYYSLRTATEQLNANFERAVRAQRDIERALGSDFHRAMHRQIEEATRYQRQIEQALGSDFDRAMRRHMEEAARCQRQMEELKRLTSFPFNI